MRRRLLIAVFLLAGAVVNVAVAWGCAAAFIPHVWTRDWRRPDAAISEWWASHAPPGFPDLPERTETIRLGGLSITSASSEASTADGQEVDRLRAGWPSRAVEGAVWIDWSQWKPGGRPTIYTDALEPRDGLFPIVLLRPIWPGFIVNTLFYAALLWFPFALRRFIRVKRGLCPACAYPMGQSCQCSECGMPLFELPRTMPRRSGN